MNKAKGHEIRRRTVALQCLLVLQDPPFVDQPLLLHRDVALLNQGSLEGRDGGIESGLHRKLGPARGSDVHGDGGCPSDGVGAACVAGIPVGAHSPRPRTIASRSKKHGSRKGRGPGLSLACKGGKGAIGSFRKRYSRNQKGGRRRNKREKVNSFLFFIFTSRGRRDFSRDVDVYRDASRPSHVTKEWGCPVV